MRNERTSFGMSRYSEQKGASLKLKQRMTRRREGYEKVKYS